MPMNFPGERMLEVGLGVKNRALLLEFFDDVFDAKAHESVATFRTIHVPWLLVLYELQDILSTLCLGCPKIVLINAAHISRSRFSLQYFLQSCDKGSPFRLIHLL